MLHWFPRKATSKVTLTHQNVRWPETPPEDCCRGLRSLRCQHAWHAEGKAKQLLSNTERFQRIEVPLGKPKRLPSLTKRGSSKILGLCTEAGAWKNCGAQHRAGSGQELSAHMNWGAGGWGSWLPPTPHTEWQSLCREGWSEMPGWMTWGISPAFLQAGGHRKEKCYGLFKWMPHILILHLSLLTCHTHDMKLNLLQTKMG